MRFLWFVLLLLPLVVTTTPDDLKAVPRYKVDLDKPPGERWTHIVTKFPQMTKGIRSFLLSLVPKYLIPVVDKVAENMFYYLPHEYAEEISSIGKALKFSPGEVLLYNLAYELTAYCTGIVSQDVKGNIWHSRNLDYGFSDLLRNLTIHVDFQRGGKTKFSVVTFVGYVGALTGQRPGVFTVNVDERDQGGWLKNLLVVLFDHNFKLMGFQVRDTLAHSPSFSSAVKSLANTDTVADVYYIVGGINPGEGAVITKSRTKADDIWYINETNSRWFVVETNYDHWKPPPSTDDRRHPAIHAMEKMGQNNISAKNLLRVLSTPPVFSKKTVYTTVMSAARPQLMESWIRYPGV